MASLTSQNISLTTLDKNKTNSISFQNPYGLENSYDNISPNIPEVPQFDHSSINHTDVNFNHIEKNFCTLKEQIVYLKDGNEFFKEKISKLERSARQKDEKIDDLVNKLNQLADIVLKNKKDIEVLSKRNLTVNFGN